MRIDYNRLRNLNIESLITGNNGTSETMPCFYVIQNLVEKVLYGETLSEIQKRFLIELNVLIEDTQEERKKIVEPFKMDMGNDRPQSN